MPEDGPTAPVRIIDRPAGGLIGGSLPAACALCEKGTKMVLFLTGHCHYNCFYCPVSAERRNVDRTFANERELDPGDLEAIAREAESMGAYGTGITGGDPMYRPQRAVDVIRFLKERFGPRHHIHLYTNIVFDRKWVRELDAAGLDELRFHPPPAAWTTMDSDGRADLIRHALTFTDPNERRPRTGLSVGIEVPCPPDMERELSELIEWLIATGVDHINLNELEFSPTNADNLLERDYEVRDATTMRVQGSRELAMRLIERFRDRITIHFCSSPFKDAVQLKNRLRRQADRLDADLAEVTDDGTVQRGLVITDRAVPLSHELRRRHNVPTSRFRAEPGRGRLIVHPATLVQLADLIEAPAFLSEVYPTSKEIEVERIPLNDAARVMRPFEAPRAAPSRFP